MFIDPTRLWEQIALGEDSGLELKEVQVSGRRVSAPRRDALADELAAFANSKGGRLVLGVSDDREPQALQPDQLDVLTDHVTQVCKDSIVPPLEFSVYRVPIPSGAGSGGVLLVEIPAGDAVHRSPGGYLRRRGDTKRQMQPDDIRRLLQARGQSDVAATDSQVVRNTGVNSLRPELWRRYASSRTSDPDAVALAKLKFVKDDPRGTLRATVGGVLLAAEDPRQWMPNAYIQAVCYEGTNLDGNRQLDAQDIGGALDQQIRDAMRFVVRNRRVAARQQPARSDVPQFSERAVFEAVVNAVVHRDYAVSGSHIRLFMFDDRLELFSPGGLCNSMTTDDLRTSQFTRNEILASRLGQCPVGEIPGSGGRQYFIERRGEGIAVIEDETLALAGKKPAFELIGDRELMLVLPSASPPVPDGISAHIAVLNGETNGPLPEAHLLLVYPDKTYLEARTDAFGHAEFVLHRRLPMIVMCAATGFTACVVNGIAPGDPLELRMQPAPHGGSLIIANRTGNLPGIRGRLYPMLDGLDRSYLYAHNVAINDGMQQPVNFNLNEPVRLTDSTGTKATLWFREMVGSSCIFDYRYD
jgi:predicted HTH transcriptional regulator